MKVFVDVNDKRWNKYKINFEKIANAAVSGVYKDSEVSIILVDDSEIRRINEQYRGIKRPTNVLSFELGDDLLLGDIYISLDTVLREAKNEKISVDDHVAHLVVHGVLHLLGEDHLTDEQAQIMEGKEIKILKKLGIKNPYQDDEVSCTDEMCCPGGRFVALRKRVKIRENSVWQYLLYAVFGGIAAFGFAPFYQWWWTLLGIGGAYWLTVRNKNIGGFWWRLCRVAPFGAMYCVAMFWWVLHSIYVVPELTRQFAVWTIPGVVGLLIAGVVIFSWPLVVVGGGNKSAGQRVFLFAAVWTLVLWGREWMFTGFPWNPLANIAMPWPMLINSLAVWGALGLTFVIAGIIAAAVEVVREVKNVKNWLVMMFFVCTAVIGCVLGGQNMVASDFGADTTGPIIRIVQPGKSQVEKATHSREEALEKAAMNLNHLVTLSMKTGKPDVIIFPETTYPFVVMDGDRMELASLLGRPIVMGATTFDNGALFNSMLVADEFGNVRQIYSKSHLVPFGEYRPLGFLPSPVNLNPGNGPDVLAVGDFLLVPAICYEIIFSDSLMEPDLENVHAIVNITNDNWFGNTPGTYQHLDMVRRYAIESGLPVVRANYSGISAFVAADGEIVSMLPVGEPGVLDGFVWGGHVTPYRIVGLDMWMIIILVVSVIGVGLFAKKR